MSERSKKKAMFLFSICFIFLCIVGISTFWLHSCQQAAFEHISIFCEILVKADPETEQQVRSALKEYNALPEQEINGNDFLAPDGYRVDEFCKRFLGQYFFLSSVLFLGIACIFFISTRSADKRNRKRIAELTDYLEQVNLGAGGTIMQMQEDDFSHLQDEIYTTVTTLYQTRETAVAARKRFAENLENIAHQLKTPITAAFLSLQLMKKTVPNDYGKQIEKQLERLNRLEESLLTLSKIDAGTLSL